MRSYLRATIVAILTVVSLCAAEPERYRPLFATATPAKTQSESSLDKDFRFASASRSLPEARKRWESFLKKHSPPNGEFQDNFQKMRVDVARYELVRVYYLSGLRSQGDKLLRELNPLGLQGN